MTTEQFKNQYHNIKEKILQYQKKLIELQKEIEVDEQKISLLSKKELTNEFLRKIINRIEIYSDLKIEIIFKFQKLCT